MKYVERYFTLDITKESPQLSISVRKGDSAQRFHIAFSNGGESFSLEGMHAVAFFKRSDGVSYYGDCIVSPSEVVITLGASLTGVAGRHTCDITLYNTRNSTYSTNGECVTSPSFYIVSYAGVSSSPSVTGTAGFKSITTAVKEAEALAEAAEMLKEHVKGIDAAVEIAAILEDEKNVEGIKAGVRAATLLEENIDILKNGKETMGKFLTNSGYITIPADAWKDDYDEETGNNLTRVRCNVGADSAYKTVIGTDSSASNKVKLTGEWQTFTGTFTLAEDLEEFRIRVSGGTLVTNTHPFDIADVKLYLTDDTAKTNLLPEDIALLYWSPKTSTVDKFAVSYEDGVKYIHVWKRSGNNDSIYALTKMTLAAGTYTIECRMRSKGTQLYYIHPFPQIRDSSATQITPVLSSADMCTEHKVRGFAQRVGEIAFTADTRPTEDVTVAVSATFGQGGSMMNVGAKGEKGDDYALTDDDKNDISALVLESLPTWDGGAY